MYCKLYPSTVSILIVLLITFADVGCKPKRRYEDAESKSPIERLDSQNRANEFQAFAENCNEKEVKAKFLEWMELYYPDWPIKGKLKIFEAAQTNNSFFGTPCPYNIRFQTVNPHLKSFAEKEIIIVRFEWKDSRFQGFSIEPVRGVLY